MGNLIPVPPQGLTLQPQLPAQAWLGHSQGLHGDGDEVWDLQQCSGTISSHTAFPEGVPSRTLLSPKHWDV